MSSDTRHILRAEQYNEGGLLDHLIERTEHFENRLNHPGQRSEVANEHAGKVLFSVFYEPSTRTSFSFRTAATRLGMAVVGTESAGQFSSVAKGETLEDTTRVLVGNRPDVVVVRHPDDGAVEKMAEYSGYVPIVNAGDGRNEHPTQALLDVFTIQKKFGRRDNLRIVIGGDISGGRTAKSLLNLLGVSPSNSFELVAPKESNADEQMKQKLNNLAAEIGYSYELTDETLKDTDVVYWTRTQTERGSGEQNTDFILRPELLGKMSNQGIIMHPLPRLSELPEAIDHDPRAHYFEQAANGLPVRMALLDWVLQNPTNK